MNINFTKEVPRPPALAPVSFKRGSLFELVILLVMAGLFFWFVIRPKIADLTTRQAHLTVLETESDKLKDQQGRLEDLVVQLENSAAEVTKLDEALPLHPRTTWVYLLVENLVQSSGLTVSSLNVIDVDNEIVAADKNLIQNPYAAKRQVKKMSANLAMTGTLLQFEAFLEKMENSSRLMDIKSLDISSSADQLLDFRLSFDAYYFAP